HMRMRVRLDREQRIARKRIEEAARGGLIFLRMDAIDRLARLQGLDGAFNGCEARHKIDMGGSGHCVGPRAKGARSFGQTQQRVKGIRTALPPNLSRLRERSTRQRSVARRVRGPTFSIAKRSLPLTRFLATLEIDLSRKRERLTAPQLQSGA